MDLKASKISKKLIQVLRENPILSKNVKKLIPQIIYNNNNNNYINELRSSKIEMRGIYPVITIMMMIMNTH